MSCRDCRAKMKRFKVACVSENTNSFGLFGVIMIAEDGSACKIGASMYNKPEVGKVMLVDDSQGVEMGFTNLGFEIPERLVPNAPKDVVSSVWEL